MRAHRTATLALSVAAAAVVASSAFEPAARACDPSVDESTLVDEGLGDTQAHRVERVPRNYAYVHDSSYADGTDTPVAIAGSPIPLYRHRALLPIGPYKRGSRTAQVDDRIDSQPPGRASLRSGVLQLQDWGCDTATNSLTLELGAEVVDDQTLPGEITYAIFAGATREQAESAVEVTQFRVATGTTIRIGTGAPDLVWISVAAIDLAGNIGLRSEPLEIARNDARGKDGCSAAPGSSSFASNFLPFGVIFALGVRRARRLPQRSSRRRSRFRVEGEPSPVS